MAIYFVFRRLQYLKRIPEKLTQNLAIGKPLSTGMHRAINLMSAPAEHHAFKQKPQAAGQE